MLTEGVKELRRSMEDTLRELEGNTVRIETLAHQLACAHRCWASRWSVGGLLVLLAYAIFMHSFHFVDHQQEQAIVAAHLTQMEHRLAALEASLVIKKRWWQR